MFLTRSELGPRLPGLQALPLILSFTEWERHDAIKLTTSMARLRLDPTLAGGFSVLVWGCALPVVKAVEDRIGVVAFLGFAFTSIATFGALRHLLKGLAFPIRGVFKDWRFYTRWICFVLHEGLLAASVALVQRRHMPFVILLNYLWPTTIILCSVLLGAVVVTQWWSVIAGSLLVVGSIGFEVLGSRSSTIGLFTSRTDCLAYILVFTGAVSWGFYSAFSRRFAQQTGGVTVLPLFQATLGFAVIVCFRSGNSVWSNLSFSTAALLFSYCFLLFVAYLAWDRGMREGNVVVLSLFADLIPWLSLIATSVALHVAIPRQAAFAAIFLVVGAFVTRMGIRLRPADAVFDEPIL